jgi:hypothetical protein
MAKSNFIVRGGADFSAIPKELQKLQGQFNGFSKSIGAGLKIAAASAIVKELVSFGKEALQVASDLQEVQNVVDVTFGSMSSEVNQFASNALKQFGLSELSAKKFTSTMGAMLKSSGISGTQAKDMSIEIAKLTADMASFYNLDHEEAFTKIQAGLSGETEPLKRLGINMNVANMEAYAMSQGINKAWKEMSQAEQTLLRYNYLLSVTGDSQGDFARTSGSWANQVKLLKEQWKEFMGLIGQALTKILLPIVQALNKMLEFLINITKEIGKIYTMITGKEVAVESNNAIAGTASDAAEGEEDLADGIGEASKAAKKALASFDELNLLQSGLGESSSVGLPGTTNIGGLNTSITTTKVDDGFDEARENGERYFVWLENRWKGLKQTLEMPIRIPSPVFASLQEPIWQPNYGLEGVPTFIPAPVFEPLPNPIWQPNWNIGESLQAATSYGLQKFNEFKTNFSFGMNELVTSVSTSAITLKDNVVTSTQGMFESASIIYANMKTNAIENMKSMKETLVVNAQEMQTEVSSAVSGMATSAASSIYQMANSGINNINSMFSSTYANLSNWISNSTSSLAEWGNGMISTISSTVNGMIEGLVSGLKSMYEKLKEYAKATGEKMSGSFSGSYSLAKPKFISPVGIAIGALSLMKGILTMPRMGAGAYAKGGIIDKPTLAMMGEGGKKEIVMPMQSNTGWIAELATMITGTMPGQSSGGDMIIIVKIGEDTITEKMVSNMNRLSRINGKTIITV